MTDWPKDNQGRLSKTFEFKNYRKSFAFTSQVAMLSEKKIIIKLVVITNNKFVLKPKFEDAKTLGIIKNIIKGFTIPPVK